MKRHCSICHLPGHTKLSHTGARTRRNVAGYIGDDDKFHPIRGSRGYDRVKSGDDAWQKAAAFRKAKRRT